MAKIDENEEKKFVLFFPSFFEGKTIYLEKKFFIFYPFFLDFFFLINLTLCLPLLPLSAPSAGDALDRDLVFCESERKLLFVKFVPHSQGYIVYSISFHSNATVFVILIFECAISGACRP